jgi:hypothetical protein
MLPNSASADRAPAFTQATQAQGNVELTVEGAAEEEEAEGSGKDGVGNLSGGERSFTTLVRSQFFVILASLVTFHGLLLNCSRSAKLE